LPSGQPPLCCPSANRQQIRSGTPH
jgi:hypothetical protein